MTSAPMTTSAASLANRAAPSPGMAAPPATATIDPFKLLNKYKWLLVIAAFLGAALGAGAHFALLKVYPVWRPIMVFRCFPPTGSSVQGFENLALVNNEEMVKFMATEARSMTSDGLLARVSQSPELQARAKKWCERFYKTDASGLRVFSDSEALEELQDTVRARVVPQTYFIELSLGYREKEQATTVLEIIGNTYLRAISDEGNATMRDRIEALRASERRTADEIDAVTRRRDDLISRNQIPGGLSDRQGAILNELNNINQEVTARVQGREATKSQLDSLLVRLEQPSLQFPDELIAESERDPEVLEAQRVVNGYETERQAMLIQGIAPDHKSVKSLESRRAAAEQKLTEVRNRIVRKLFDGRVGELQEGLKALDAQIAELSTQSEDKNKRLVEITRLNQQLEDYNTQIRQLQQNQATNQAAMTDIQARSTVSTANRVIVHQQARVPNEISFPKLTFLVPAGVMLLTLLVGGVAIVRDLVDQRVKSPADIALIPRTRLLGWVPDAAEDPESSGAIETAFRDSPRGVVAESFRQVRSAVAKRLLQSGHKALLVMSGMPASGATSVACNLALACAAAEAKVLLIDANFRRPSVHRVFKAPDHPGLADVLARGASLDGAVQSVQPGLDILTAGTKDLRVVERLSTDTMGAVIAAARESYDLVILDAPPAIVAGDGLALAARTDASILVVRAFAEKRGMIARFKNDLSESRGEFLGVVVNAVRAATGGYLKSNIQTSTDYHKA